MIPVSLSPAAYRDLQQGAAWIAKDNPAAARALRIAAARAARTLGEHRHAGSSRPEIVGEPYRCLNLVGFPYVIVYNAERQPPRITRILRGARVLPEILRLL